MADVPIKETSHFTPIHKQHRESEQGNLTGVVIKNLPEQIPKEEVEEFLKTKGLTEEGKVKVIHNKKNTKVDIEELKNETAKLLIKNLHEQIFFNRKIYCRGLLNVETPAKSVE